MLRLTFGLRTASHPGCVQGAHKLFGSYFGSAHIRVAHTNSSLGGEKQNLWVEQQKRQPNLLLKTCWPRALTVVGAELGAVGVARLEVPLAPGGVLRGALLGARRVRADHTRVGDLAPWL